MQHIWLRNFLKKKRKKPPEEILHYKFLQPFSRLSPSPYKPPSIICSLKSVPDGSEEKIMPFVFFPLVQVNHITKDGCFVVTARVEVKFTGARLEAAQSLVLVLWKSHVRASLLLCLH